MDEVHPARLTTKRTCIEPISLDQADAAYPALSDPRVYTFIPEEPPASASALREKWVRYLAGPRDASDERWLNWTVWLQDAEQVIGTLQATVFLDGSRAEIAYLFASAHWGLGLAAESVGAMCTWLFAACGLALVEAQVDTRNEASRRLLERLGFERVRLSRAADVFKGTVSSEYLYRLTYPPGGRTTEGTTE